MKVGILAGGYGTRLAEETEVRPKPMVEIGGRPILWHIMMHYAHYGHTDFLVALGYKGEYIKRWFVDFGTLEGSLTIRTRKREIINHSTSAPDWNVDLIETGIDTLTAGRIKRLQPWIGNSTFMLTWGDCVSDVNLNSLLAFHRGHGRLATMTAVRPPARYGHLDLNGDRIVRFTEKPQISEGRINGAYFVLEPGIFDYIAGDDVMWEQEPLTRLAADGELMAFKHSSFWQCMDTLREKHLLNDLWDKGNAPWQIWS